MLTGRKLLLADDSAAIQKVIELTFADEGVEVITVSNGRLALEKLEHLAPDIVLADVFMPEVGGLELCRFIKQNERLAHTPVMLLVSSFEPFDEDEARRAGANDVVTKPFQSIRQLISRVGSLLSGGAADSEPTTERYSTLGLTGAEPQTSAAPASDQNVTVLVEAAKMSPSEFGEPAGATCVTDVELQTADTQQLERIVDEPAETPLQDDLRFQDTIEFEPIDHPEEDELDQSIEPEEPQYSQFAETTEINIQSLSSGSVKTVDAGVLDLDDSIGEETISDDVVLDLEFEVPSPEIIATASAPAPETISTGDVTAAESAAATVATEETTAIRPPAPAELSAEAVDAIARRVVEQMSDQAVREIAWEVVPELAELLIKQKLEEKK